MGSRLAKLLVLLALVLYLVFLIVARTPAAWGVWAIHNAAPGVRLTGISGTIWEGRAVSGTIALGNQLIPVENLRWEIKPWSLLAFRPCADIGAQLLNQPASGTVCHSLAGTTAAQNLQVSAPMNVLGKRMGVDVAGQASVQIQNVELDGERVEALEGNFSWRDARWYDGERWVPVGSYAARLAENEQGGIHAQIFELDGPFKVDMTGDFVLHQEPVIKGTVHPAPNAPEPIRAALEFVGERLGDGGFRIAWPPGT